MRGEAWDGRGGGREGHANGVLDLVVPDPVMTRTDVRAACATAKEVGEVGQLKRNAGPEDAPYRRTASCKRSDKSGR